MTQHYTPITGLLVVDVQNDFATPGGSLYVQGGEDIVPGINQEIDAAAAAGATIVYTQDWHPESTPHFAKDGGLWPVHCVMGSYGAEFVEDLKVVGPVVQKGSGPEDGYSGFSVLHLHSGDGRETELDSLLVEHGVTNIVVVGLAGDWCVRTTAEDGVRLGYDVTVPLDLTRFVELHPGDGERAVEQMRDAGVKLV